LKASNGYRSPARLRAPARTQPARRYPDGYSWRPRQAGAPIGRHIVDRGMAAQLQRPDIGDDCPAVVRRHAGGVGIHYAITVGDDVEEMLVVGSSQPVVVIAGRTRHAALDHNAVAVAARPITGRAKNAEALPAARQ